MPSSAKAFTRLLRLAAGIIGFSLAAQALAQTLDTPLTLLVAASAGGSTDRSARILAQALEKKLGVAVIVENQGAAGGLVAARRVKDARPGDNLLLVGTPTTNVLAPIVFKDAGYDPQTDFVPISCIRTYFYALAVGPNVPVLDTPGLLAWLRENPRQANFGVPALGGVAHVFALMIAEAGKVSPEVIGYRGSAPVLLDLLAGNLPVAVDVVETVLGYHTAGKLRILAVSSDDRLPELPEVPTLKEAGIGASGDGWSTLFASASMPAAKVGVLARAVVEAMGSAGVQSQFRAGGLVPVVMTPVETARMLAAYRTKWEPFARAAGVRR